MHIIQSKKLLSRQVVRLEVNAPLIAAKRKPGQFVILRINEKGERIPLTIVDSDVRRGTITLVFQVVGKTTHALSSLEQGASIQDLAGPLGKPTEIERFGNIAVVGGGIGIAVAFPIAQAMKQAGNRVLSILGARTRELLILKDEVGTVSDKLEVTTDDGSLGRKGLVTEPLRDWLESERIDLVLAIGPVPMMQAVSDLTKPFGVRTVVSLNPIMVDGTGMCGACRVLVGGRTKFACVDGPEFDGHKVDYEDLTLRLSAYREQEKVSFNTYLQKIE